MNTKQMDEVMEAVFQDVRETRAAGQAEYAREDENIFANFERVAAYVGISREQALMVYTLKHIDGIQAWVNGHRSQREDVRGRIKDVIVYLLLLQGMADEAEPPEKREKEYNSLVNQSLCSCRYCKCLHKLGVVCPLVPPQKMDNPYLVDQSDEAA